MLPAGNYYAGQAVAEDVYGGAAHVHELIDGKEQKEGLGGQMEGGGGGEDDYQRGASDSGGAFAADQQGEEHDGLLRDGEMDSGGLSDENQREGLVEAGAIEIEAVAGGEDEGDSFAGYAERFHLFHGAWKSGFGAGGGEGDGDGFGGGAEEFLYRNAGKERDRKQHTSDEHD